MGLAVIEIVVWQEVHRCNEGEPVNITEGHVIIQ